MDLRFFAVLFLLFLPDVYSLEWTSSTLQQTTLSVCRGQNLLLDWGFILNNTETVRDVRWDFASERSQEVIAMSVRGNFEVMAAFSGRVSHPGNASLVLKDVTLGDAGNYSVEVNAHRPDAGTYSVIRHTVVVTVAGPQVGESNRLTLTQLQQAVYDVTTDSYHVQLSCGVLADLGVPPVDVTWQTPSGSEEVSSTQDNGTFYLRLKNPVQGGNYSCRLSAHSAAALCLAGDDPLLEQTTLYVDGVMVRLAMLEAKEEELRRDNKQKTDEISHLKDELNQLKNSNLTQRVNQPYNKSALRVQFHARQPFPASPGSGNPLKFNYIVTNEGDAYDRSTGDFTAPVSGNYVFIVTTSSTSNNYGNFFLMVDDTEVAWAMSTNNNYYNPATAHVALHLRQGQRVWVRCRNDGVYMDFSSFTGFLLSPDW